MTKLENDIDDAVLIILSTLHTDALDTDNYRSESGLSLAKLSKRTALRMSTLLRHLTALEAAEMVGVIHYQDGTGRAALAPYGLAIFDALNHSQSAAIA